MIDKFKYFIMKEKLEYIPGAQKGGQDVYRICQWVEKNLYLYVEEEPFFTNLEDAQEAFKKYGDV